MGEIYTVNPRTLKMDSIPWFSPYLRKLVQPPTLKSARPTGS